VNPTRVAVEGQENRIVPVALLAGAMAPRLAGVPDNTLTVPEPFSTGLVLMDVMVALPALPNPEFSSVSET
jgi:hypothetical protein